MPNFSYHDILLTQNMWESSATQKAQLGTRGYTADGRAYRYAKAGAVALVAGNVLQGPATIAGHLNLTGFTGGAAAGTLQILVTCASTAATNLYAEGYICVGTAAGEGYTYSILSHAAVSTGAVGTFNLYPDDPVQVTTTAAGTYSLLQNKYNGVIQMPVTTATGPLVGVAPYVIGVTQFGWIQTWGPCATWLDATAVAALGELMISPGTSAGQASTVTAANLLVGQIVGHMCQIGVDKRHGYIDLRISP